MKRGSRSPFGIKGDNMRIDPEKEKLFADLNDSFDRNDDPEKYAEKRMTFWQREKHGAKRVLRRFVGAIIGSLVAAATLMAIAKLISMFSHSR